MRRETGRLRLAKLAGVTFVNQYVVIKYLGKGANGRVFLCLDMADTRLYAVKVPPATIAIRVSWLYSRTRNPIPQTLMMLAGYCLTCLVGSRALGRSVRTLCSTYCPRVTVF